MKHIIKPNARVSRIVASLLMLYISGIHCHGEIAFNTVGAGAESIYASWPEVNGAVGYKVSYAKAGMTDVEIDECLVRRYTKEYRVDIPGISEGSYSIKVRAYDLSGLLIDEGGMNDIQVHSAVREGFAFNDGNMPGAYKADGTLKDDARVLYVSANTVNTVACEVIKDKKGGKEVKTGLAEILSAIGKGYDKRPLAIRIIGTVSDAEFSGLKDGNYINFQGNNATDRRIENITLEGVGTDATLYGYGICLKRSHNIEVRNIGIMLFGDDAISMDTDNSNIWLHNIDFFYGRPGKDADQVKGDGSIDIKYRSTDITISYNHFFDSGKVMGCGGTTGEDENLRISYHHNWFDHADSRCPRLHYVTAHIYNNYYDGVPVYCIGNTTESSAFVECNYFRNCKRPIMISGQGTDSYDEKTGTYTLKGTFSGQDGGMNKAFNNVFAENVPKLVYQIQNPTQFDAYIVSSREEQIPETVVSVKGAWPYSNFDTDADMYACNPDAPDDVPSIVTSQAGRLCGGDFKWAFDNVVDDADHEVNAELKLAIESYGSSLIAIQGENGFSDKSGIDSVVHDGVDKGIVIYDYRGRRVYAENIHSLCPGLYIIKSGVRVYKHIVM